MKTVKQLQEERKKIQIEIDRREEIEMERVQIPRLKAMVGQCFMYPDNSYGGERVPKNLWNVYKKILEYVESKERGFQFIFEEFQVDSYGKVIWNIDSFPPYTNREWWNEEVPFSGCEKITEKEYNAEKTKMVAEMGLQMKMRKVLNTKY